MTQESSASQGIQALERATRILDEIKRNENPLTLTELSQKVGMSKNSLKKYLVSFVRTGLLTIDEKHKKYDFGYKVIEFGLNALKKTDVFSTVDPFMQKIKDEIGHSSALAIWTERGPMIAKYQSSGRSINVGIEIGYYPPLLGSSVGRCFAAFLPIYKIDEIMAREIEDYDLDREWVEKDLIHIKNLGFSSRDQHFGDLPGSHSIACPIFDYTGEMVAAICVLGFTNDLNTDKESDEVKGLKKITNQISKQLAYES